MRRFFSNLASRSSYWMGHPASFIIATLACVVWAISGPLFNYSDTWQLVINTATTVLTFLAVFLIQNSQNRDGTAIQAKLDEILIAVGKARNDLVGIENLTDAEVTELKAAIEREAHDPAAQAQASRPTVDEILERRDQEADGAREAMPAADRRKVATSAKRAVDAATQKLSAQRKKPAAKAARRAPAKKRASTGRR